MRHHAILERNLQVVKCRRDISHQGHKKEWYLKNIILQEVQSIDNCIIPGHRVEIYEEGQEP
jgi:hypothetical protein